MKQLFVLISIGLFMASCSPENSSVELRLDGILACGNPNLDINHGQIEEWESHVVEFLTGEGFTILSSRLDHELIVHEGVFCGNCWRTGDRLYVSVPEEQEAELVALGFYKE